MLELKDVRKSYKTGGFEQRALDGVSIAFRDNEFVAILGPSGSGKTTLLNVLGGLDHADSGDLVINGVSTREYRDADWDAYRNHNIGFVFQSYNLIPHQTILSNVELALTLSGVGKEERRERAREALVLVGLDEHVDKHPNQLSGGQQQRVAIARALVNDPDIVLADEPTGALDAKTGVQIMDLLKEVANDRLVVMVTHNPELAEQYATRIVRLADGRITDDSMPFDPVASDALPTEPDETLAAPPAEADAHAAASAGGDASDDARRGHGSRRGRRRGRGERQRASMSFLTALSLSLSNLLTKKGRTFLTAFAGSIGIMGIAAILAVSTGVNGYIQDTEQSAMSSYPLQITEQSANLASIFGMGGSASSERQEAEQDKGSAKKSGTIPVSTVVADSVATVDSNDLSSFKRYLDSGKSGIDEYAKAIVYDYGITPAFYCADPSKGTSQLGSSMQLMSDTAVSLASSMGSGYSSSAFEEMPDDEELVQSQYELVAGHWPEGEDECVLVLNRYGGLTDYTLYAIGMLDQDEYARMVQSLTSGESVDSPATSAEPTSLSTADALALEYSVVEPSARYQHNEATGTWTDMADDASFMASAIENGIHVRVVGVIEPKGDMSGSLSEGIAYTHALTERLMSDAASSQIVRDQLANPDVDVFTGRTFDELRSSAASSFDMGQLFTVDEDKLRSAFSFDASALQYALGSGMDTQSLASVLSQMDGTSLLDPSQLDVDTSELSGVISQDDMAKIMAGAPQPDFSGATSSLSQDEIDAITQLATNLAQGFLPWWYQAHPGEAITSDTDLSQAMQEYLATDDAQAVLAQITQIAGEGFQQQMSQMTQDYLTNQLAPYLQAQFQELASKAASAMAAQLSSQLQGQIAAATQTAGTQLSQAISSQLSGSADALASALSSSFSFDPSAFASAIQFNMTQEELVSLMQSYANAANLSYESNLTTLGYADPEKPSEIDIYPIDFDAKEQILDLIDEYNAKVKAEGHDEQAISYSDVMGSLVSSVTDIVNTVSSVLIAFVSISLVVSSIMIGIITYISVLERRKEIGILRAMGASKRNVGNVFNAETFIEGLLSGVIAVAVVFAVQPPVNAWVLDTQGVPNVMQLTPQAALVLVAISVGLTVVAGLIPARSASHADPVEALRSE
jgi:putative ABC transport system permease protein